MIFPDTKDKSIRDGLPELIGDESVFNSRFFEPVAFALSGVLEEGGKLYVNSGAEVRWAIVDLMMGERGERVESEIVEEDLHELQWEDFVSKVELDEGSTNPQRLALYSSLAAISKLVIREYKPGVEGEVATSTDTVNYVKEKDGNWVKMEKPKNLEEAKGQIDTLIAGEEFLIANASVVGKVGEQGELGVSLWMLPIRFRFDDESTKEQVRQSMHAKLEKLYAEGKGREVRPGGLSSVDEGWVDYLEVGIFETEAEHEVMEAVRNREFSFEVYLGKVRKWARLTGEELGSGAKVGLGATIIGGPVYGIKTAIMRYVRAIQEGRSGFDYWRKWIKEISRGSQSSSEE